MKENLSISDGQESEMECLFIYYWSKMMADVFVPS